MKGIPSFYLKREVDIIKQLDHPNICRFLETYMDKVYIYIVMEYCKGGTLKNRFMSKVDFTEYEVSEKQDISPIQESAFPYRNTAIELL